MSCENWMANGIADVQTEVGCARLQGATQRVCSKLCVVGSGHWELQAGTESPASCSLLL